MLGRKVKRNKGRRDSGTQGRSEGGRLRGLGESGGVSVTTGRTFACGLAYVYHIDGAGTIGRFIATVPA